jgi:hypothetical protein
MKKLARLNEPMAKCHQGKSGTTVQISSFKNYLQNGYPPKQAELHPQRLTKANGLQGISDETMLL